MKKETRNANENLEDCLNEMIIGDVLYDSVTQFKITKVPGGYLFYNDYCGIAFVPCVKDAPAIVKNAVTKDEPKPRGRKPIEK
jgi:hypothetical protein